MRSLIRKLHDRSPLGLQTAIRLLFEALPPRIKFGKEYDGYAQLLEESQWWPTERLLEFQKQKLAAILRHAYENTPYYRRLFDEMGAKPEDFREPDDLFRIPPISKQHLREHFAELTATNAKKFEPELLYTGGSTAQPVGFYADRRALIFEKATLARQWSYTGYKSGEPVAVLRGGKMKPLLPGDCELWSSSANRTLILSSYHLSRENAPRYAEKLRQFKPTLIWAFPSALTILCNLLRELDLEIPSPKGVVTSSETLFPNERAAIEEVMGCRILDYYGMSEPTACAGQCSTLEGYHVNMESAILQVEVDGRPAKEGELGELVATSLKNYSMPFIRYKTGDLAEYTESMCSCGRGLVLLRRVQGRMSEYLVSPEGGTIPVSTLNTHSEAFANIRHFQLVQKDPAHVTVRIIRSEKFTDVDRRRLLSEFSAKLEGIELDIEYVTELQKTARGKIPTVISGPEPGARS